MTSSKNVPASYSPVLRRRSVSFALLGLPALCGQFTRAFAYDETCFPFSVASGDPSDTSVVIWTRIARSASDPEPMSKSPLEVAWVVATDRNLLNVVHKGTALAKPSFGFSVHVDVKNLQSGHVYYYAFFLGGERSPVGRTKTLPSRLATILSAQISLVSCQNWENGYFDAYRGIIQDDPDFVLHLGDYIYDVTRGDGVRKHETAQLPRTLADYRRRHALYRTDPALVAAHEALPFIIVPDNHDALEQNSQDPDQLARRMAAYQAWCEFLPVRHVAALGASSMQIYRSADIGRLVKFNILDTRQFRDDETVCKVGSDPQYGFGVYEKACHQADLSSRTMLGQKQEKWLLNTLRHSGSTWNVIASTVLMSQVNMRHDDLVYRYLGGWDGFSANRERILKEIEDYKVRNPVCLSGDIHSTLVSEVMHHVGDKPASAVLPEFVGTSISSLWPEPLALPIQNALPDNPHILYYNYKKRGYLKCTFSPSKLIVENRLISSTDSPGGIIRTADSFVVEAGSPRILNI